MLSAGIPLRRLFCRLFASRARARLHARHCEDQRGNAVKLPPRNFLHLAAGAAALSTLVHVAWAQDWPTRPVTMVVPFAAGGPLDTGGGRVAAGFCEPLGPKDHVQDGVGAGGRGAAAPV